MCTLGGQNAPFLILKQAVQVLITVFYIIQLLNKYSH
jgi:hypothetical protein